MRTQLAAYAALLRVSVCRGVAQGAPPGHDRADFAWSDPIQFLGTGPRSDIRDPAILRDGDTYYLVFTMWPFRNYTDRDPAKPDSGSSVSPTGSTARILILPLSKAPGSIRLFFRMMTA